MFQVPKILSLSVSTQTWDFKPVPWCHSHDTSRILLELLWSWGRRQELWWPPRSLFIYAILDSLSIHMFAKLQDTQQKIRLHCVSHVGMWAFSILSLNWNHLSSFPFPSQWNCNSSSSGVSRVYCVRKLSYYRAGGIKRERERERFRKHHLRPGMLSTIFHSNRNVVRFTALHPKLKSYFSTSGCNLI